MRNNTNIDDILHPAHAADRRRKELEAGIARIDLELSRIAEIRGRGLPRAGKCTCWGAHQCDECNLKVQS